MAEDGWFQDQVEVISRCVLRAAAYRYAAGGKWLAAIACKATYRLIPGVAELHPEQDDVVGRDRHYRDDPKQSLLWPSDLVPPKPYADVILIGDAFAPGGKPAQSLVVRLRVGGMEKSLEVCGERGFTKDGALHQGLPFIKMPLRYENAAGGPATWNPVGVPQGAEPDARGLIRLPPIQPVGVQVTSPDAPIAPIGFGPIAASWPIRLSRLGAFAAQLPDGQWSGQPLPKQLDHGFFSCAPADQQVFLLSDNLRIVLENLHPDHPQLVTELQSVCPAVSLERGGKRPQEVGLKADTLLIDTRRGICTMVWRGLVLLREAQERCRLVVTMTTRPGCSTLVGLGPDSAPGSGAPRSQPDDGAAARPPRPTWPRSLPEEETTATQLLPPSYRRGAAAGAGETPPLQELTSAAIAEHPSGARSETQPLGPLLQGLSEGLSRQQIREQLSQAVPFKPDAAQAPLPPAGTDPSSTCRLRRVTPTSVMSPLAEPQEASSRAMPFVGGAASPPPSAGVSAVLRAAHPQAAGGLGDAAIADPVTEVSSPTPQQLQEPAGPATPFEHSSATAEPTGARPGSSPPAATSSATPGAAPSPSPPSSEPPPSLAEVYVPVSLPLHTYLALKQEIREGASLAEVLQRHDIDESTWLATEQEALALVEEASESDGEVTTKLRRAVTGSAGDAEPDQ